MRNGAQVSANVVDAQLHGGLSSVRESLHQGLWSQRCPSQSPFSVTFLAARWDPSLRARRPILVVAPLEATIGDLGFVLDAAQGSCRAGRLEMFSSPAGRGGEDEERDIRLDPAHGDEFVLVELLAGVALAYRGHGASCAAVQLAVDCSVADGSGP